MISKEKWEEMKTNENLKFWIKFELVNRIIEFWNISESKFKIKLGSNIEYGNVNDLKDSKWEFKLCKKTKKPFDKR